MKQCGMVVVLALLGACGSGLPEPGAPILKLLSAGRGPKQALRYKLQAGERQTVAMRINMDFSSLPSPPAMLLTMAIEIAHVASNGDVTYNFSIEDVEAAGSYGMSSAAQTALDDMLGLSGTAVVSARGVTKSGKVNIPPSAPAQVKGLLQNFQQSIDQFSCPFPEEPVGVGAKWELQMCMSTGAMKLYQTVVFELAEMEGTQGVLNLTLTQRADEQDMKLDGMPRGAKLRLESFKSSGSGSMEFDLKKAAPLTAHVNIDSDFKIKASLKGRSQTKKMNMRARMELDTVRR